MSIRNLDALFRPKSIAVVGGSSREESVGGVLLCNLLAGEFKGDLWIVNRNHDRVRGRKSYRRVQDLPGAPDLAVIATPVQTVTGLVRELGERGTRAAVIITAGFAELGERGETMQTEILSIAGKYGMRIVGPNCLGVLATGSGINATFAHIGARKGRLAFISQSGAILTSMLDWADTRGVGFSAMVSTGNTSDVDTGDLLDYFAVDPGTSAVLLYMEGMGEDDGQARKFMSAARGCARAKPVIVVKSGRHPAGARAASSHTAALAGSDEVYDAAFRRAGMLRVKTLEELFDAAEVLAATRPPAGRHVAVLTNGGGVGVMAADALLDEGAKLAALSEETIANLNKVLPASWSKANPVDIVGDAPPERYISAIQALLQDKGVDVVVVINCPTALSSSTAAAEAVIEHAKHKPVLAAWMGGREAAEARNRFTAAGIPAYATPEQAIRAFMYLFRYRRNQELLMQTPSSRPENESGDESAVRKIIQRALDEGREWLDEVDSKAVLNAYRIPVITSKRVQTPAEAAAVAKDWRRLVALKLLSPDILHKSEAGAVLLDVDPNSVEQMADSMLVRIRAEYPDARIEGISVQPMADRKDAWEVFAGMTVDEIFGPVILFGEGGEAVEVIADRAVALPPLNFDLAMQLIKRTRINKRLKGFRSRPPADRAALAQALVRLAHLAQDFPELMELDANPILCGPRGIEVLDARIRVARAPQDGASRFCIRPYPKDLETPFELPDGRRWLLRPVRPEDEAALQRVFDRMTPEERRNRFLGPMKVLSRAQAARYTQLDYNRDMAFVLIDDQPSGESDIHAVVRLSADADNDTAEYAVLVLKELAGHGLGTRLMRHIINYARSRGIKEIYGDVLSSNTAMLAVCRKLGFRCERDPDDAGITHVVLPLV